MTERMEQIPATISIRLQGRQRDLIDQAAGELGRSCEGFVLDAACREAMDIRLGKVHFTFSEEAFDRFQKLIDNPPEPNGRLLRLLRTKVRWE